MSITKQGVWDHFRRKQPDWGNDDKAVGGPGDMPFNYLPEKGHRL